VLQRQVLLGQRAKHLHQRVIIGWAAGTTKPLPQHWPRHGVGCQGTPQDDHQQLEGLATSRSSDGAFGSYVDDALQTFSGSNEEVSLLQTPRQIGSGH
jgi:hypothetical protein